jgi:hypothetical protein
MAPTLGNAAALSLLIIGWMFLISFLLKIRWWRYPTGITTLIMTCSIVFTMTYVLGRRIGFITDYGSEWVSFLVFGSLALAILLDLIYLWYKNKNWAWSKEDSDE